MKRCSVARVRRVPMILCASNVFTSSVIKDSNYRWPHRRQIGYSCAAAQDDSQATQEPVSQHAPLLGFETQRRAMLAGALSTITYGVTTEPSAAAPQQQPNSKVPRMAAVLMQDAPATACGEAGGVVALRDPIINRGCATPAAVRQQRHINGLLPPRQVGLDVEVLRAQAALAACCTPLEKHRLLVTLKETNQEAFYSLLQSNIEQLLPLVYTPTIGDACLQWGSLVPRPAGLYISLQDQGKVRELLMQWPSDDVRIAVVTDGERILGLGDLGAHGMGIPTGKCVVYAAAGVVPSWLLPITVDVGTNNRELQADPLYIGLPTERVRGKQYEALMLEVVAALQERFGRQVLVHWEDLAARNAFTLLRLMSSTPGVPTFNDDIQATAAVALAAILGASAVPGVLPLQQQRWLFFGAGQANLGTAQLLVKALQQEGMSPLAARACIWMVDSKGLILSSRDNLTAEKAEFAQDASTLVGGGILPLESNLAPGTVGQLAAIVSAVQPTALIGAAAVAGAFGQTVIERLVQSVIAVGGAAARPLVLALSNPTSKAEVSFSDALLWSGGRVVYGSGSPFPSIAFSASQTTTGHSSSSGRTPSSSSDGSLGGAAPAAALLQSEVLVPGQANNCLIFPGLSLGVVNSGAVAVTDELLLAAARAVAGMLTSEDVHQESVLPKVARLPQITQAVATAVAAAAPAAGKQKKAT